MSNTLSTNIERPPWSTRFKITWVPTFPPAHPKALIPRSPDGAEGIYRVTFVLALPGKELFHASIDYEALMNAGDSLLTLPAGVAGAKVEMRNEQGSVEAMFWGNTRGNLSKGQIRLLAKSFTEAERVAWDLILPLLSWWSYRYDVALDVAGYEVLEENTDVHRCVFGVLGQQKTLMIGPVDAQVASTPQYRALFAAYREAGNATNPFYQFLCYYRVVEGVRKLRTQRRQAALGTGQEYRETKEVIPVDMKIHELWEESFRPYRGKKFNWVLDRLRSLLRNAVAHLDPTADSLTSDKYDDVTECDKALPVVKYMAREMLRNELVTDFGVSPSAISE